MKNLLTRIFWGSEFENLRGAILVIVIIISSFGILGLIWISVSHSANSSISRYSTTYIEGVKIEMLIRAEIEQPFWQATDYSNEVNSKVKAAMANLSLEQVLANPDNYVEKTKRNFNKEFADRRTSISSISVDFKLPDDIAKQLRDIVRAKQEIMAIRYNLIRDSLMSVAAKRDAEGYTAVSERLEDRRDKRQLSQETIRSNERIENRKAQAREKAAENVGIFRSFSYSE